jgi:monoamine oxidase
MAAWELSATGKKTAVIEARNRIGGRIETIYSSKFFTPVESGAEFVHGDLKITRSLIKKAGLKEKKIDGSIWQKKDGKFCEQEDFIEDYDLLEKKFKELKEDISVQEFFDRYLKEDKFEQVRYTLKNYVEGYYAGNISNASALALCRELTTSSDKQFRIEEGYQKLADYLAEDSREKGCMIYLSSEVIQVSWKKNEVRVTTKDGNDYHAQKIIITVPLGVLKSEVINFAPAIEAKINIAKQLGFGAVVKVILEFKTPFWLTKEITQQKDLSDLSFLFTTADVPVWWTQFPDKTTMITGWLGGPNASKLENHTGEEIIDQAILALASVFELEPIPLREALKSSHVSNWTADPYSAGGYSYEVINGRQLISQMKQPLEDTVYFAGEGLFDGAQIGTVEGALYSGRETAHQVISAM